MRLLAAVLFAACLALPACGGTSEPDITRATLALEGPPAAVHAGIEVAVAREFDRGEDVDLVVRPARAAARADLRLLDIAGLAAAQARGEHLVGVMALVQTPLVAVLSEARDASALDGRRVAVSRRAGDRAVLRTVAPGARPVEAEDPVGELAAGRVAGAVGRIDDRRAGGLHAFRPDDAGGPTFPQLVLAARRETLQDKPRAVSGTVAALRRGYDEAVRDPELAVSTLIRRTPLRERDRAALTEAFRSVAPAFTSGGGFGAFDERSVAVWRRWVRTAG